MKKDHFIFKLKSKINCDLFKVGDIATADIEIKGCYTGYTIELENGNIYTDRKIKRLVGNKVLNEIFTIIKEK